MLRELSSLRELQHPNISCPRKINLAGHKLFVYFDYVDRTLHDYLATSGGGGRPLTEPLLRDLLRQLLRGVACCHRKGILHRNLKPKHLLVTPGQTSDPLVGATLQISDFALVRLLTFPRRTYTSEVVTLWYRPPEILMGTKRYGPPTDMWSVGCIFAEMGLGQPLFTGTCEVDQLFKIFSQLGTPTSDSWGGFQDMAHFASQFPRWEHDRLDAALSTAVGFTDSARSLLRMMLRYDPSKRITAEQALQHPFLAEPGKSGDAPGHASDADSSTSSTNHVLTHMLGKDACRGCGESTVDKQQEIKADDWTKLTCWLLDGKRPRFLLHRPTAAKAVLSFFMFSPPALQLCTHTRCVNERHSSP